MLKRLGAAIVFIAAGAFPASAQETKAQSDITLEILLNRGFSIVAMHYLNQSMVFTLQRHSVAYVCDTTLNGETKICVRLR